jgi:hypothetical protein
MALEGDEVPDEPAVRSFGSLENEAVGSPRGPLPAEGDVELAATGQSGSVATFGFARLPGELAFASLDLPAGCLRSRAGDCGGLVVLYLLRLLFGAECD